MNSKFNGCPEKAADSEAQFWRSMDELLPLFECEGIALNLETHPGDFEESHEGGLNLVRAIDKPWVRYVYCAPHLRLERQGQHGGRCDRIRKELD